MKQRLRYLLTLSILALCASQAFAQFGGSGSAGGGRRGRSSDPSTQGAGSASTTPGSRTSQTADKLYDLRMRLLITPEQSVAWDVFYAKAMALASAPGSTRMADSYGPALPILEQRLADARTRATLLQALTDATRALYGLLTHDQAATADQYLPAAIP
jgi:hypothetical protein